MAEEPRFLPLTAAQATERSRLWDRYRELAETAPLSEIERAKIDCEAAYATLCFASGHGPGSDGYHPIGVLRPPMEAYLRDLLESRGWVVELVPHPNPKHSGLRFLKLTPKEE